MKPFIIIKSNAGKETQSESPILILTTTPNNINKAKPPDAKSNNGWNFKPNSKPIAPKSSKTAVSAPTFSSPKRLNSLFIFVEVKKANP